MSSALTISAIAILTCLAFLLAQRRASKIEYSGKKLHSRPRYHGSWAALQTFLPAIILFVGWQAATQIYLEHTATRAIAEAPPGALMSRSLTLATVKEIIAHPLIVERMPSDHYNDMRQFFDQQGFALPLIGNDYELQIARNWIMRAQQLAPVGRSLTLLIAFGGMIYSLLNVKARCRARTRVEAAIKSSLILASTLAVLTTVGIVLSMLFESTQFFHEVSWVEFYFGTVWDPRFAAAGSTSSGQFGLVPLLAGTLYIALVAMVFAVPIGLMAAIYMSEYASHSARAIIKPLLEVLAGIPTIVYGFFALITVGPFLRDLSAAMVGGHGFIMAQSVFTAGLVMGIMLIPFVSSLSDDILTAVPRSLRDGSYGLGATQSETIKRVVVPAALPGIVGALLLTASRAIGETMIVVLAAGVAANLTFNPFEGMTTITVKIVNQLTGDLEFNSPQTLVAFALGLTLFVLTLIMNIVALYVVRKYREQYE